MKNGGPGKKTGVMTKEQVAAKKASYEAQTGKKYVAKAAAKAAPRTFKSNAEKEAWMKKNR